MKKILVVDDSKTILSLLEQSFSLHEDVEVFYAKSYKEATKIMVENAKNIGVALLDVNLPDAPNGEVISFAYTHNIPTIVLTGTLNKNIRNTIQRKNIVSYILKNKPSSIELAVKTAVRTLQNHNKTIMVVDDSKVYRAILTDILKKSSFNIIEVNNGQEALDLLKNHDHNVSIVITDYEMPILNGLELTIQLRELYDKYNLSIIAISSIDDKNVIDDFLTFGANDFIHKPFTSGEVIARVNLNLELLDSFTKITNMANRDFLTNAYNRRFFFESGNNILLKAQRKTSPIAVVMLDIDKFKNINDTYGHNVGDIAIKEIKKILDANLRRSDLCARFGGEEFCILLEDITMENTKLLFEKIREVFANNIISVNGFEIKYTVSFGIAFGLLDSLDEMIKIADEALYDSKENGRNRVTLKSV